MAGRPPHGRPGRPSARASAGWPMRPARRCARHGTARTRPAPRQFGGRETGRKLVTPIAPAATPLAAQVSTTFARAVGDRAHRDINERASPVDKRRSGPYGRPVSVVHSASLAQHAGCARTRHAGRRGPSVAVLILDHARHQPSAARTGCGCAAWVANEARSSSSSAGERSPGWVSGAVLDDQEGCLGLLRRRRAMASGRRPPARCAAKRMHQPHQPRHHVSWPAWM